MSEFRPPSSKAGSINPKDLVGNTKVSISKLPPVAIIHGSHAMMDGARKYGAYNWRAKDVVASIYYDAALRHIMCWFEGEEIASDSGVHHLGHAIACCAILLDAHTNGNLIDDRPVTEGSCNVATKVLEELRHKILAKTGAMKSPVGEEGIKASHHATCNCSKCKSLSVPTESLISGGVTER